MVHVPFLMFPFVRENITTTTRNGGYPPLLIEPNEFGSLYFQKKNERKKTQENNTQNNVA